MDRECLLLRLPEPYAEALRLHDAGRDDAIAERLGIEREAVGPLIRLAEAKLVRLRDPAGKQ
ncbi:MAG: hypothetical protein L0206_08065 [Actinobacteria bacterium]|nr:hypothetical protein [Actinomycetota bacterium]